MSKRSFRSIRLVHRVRRRGIHADLAVPVDRHEAERGVDRVVDHGEIELVALGDRRPVVHARAAERIDAHADLRAADRIHVDDVAEIADVVVEIVVRCVVAALRALASVTRFTPSRFAASSAVASVLDPAGDLRVGRAAVRRVVLEAAAVAADCATA